MSQTYSYTYSQFTASQPSGLIDLFELQTQVAAAITPSPTIQYIYTIGTTYYLVFDGTLSAGQITTLNGIIAAYTITVVQEVAVSNTSTTTFTNKNLVTNTNFFVDATDATKRIAFLCSSNTTGITATFATQATTARTLTFPDVTDTVVTLTASQTLTNKTLSKVTIAGTGSTTASTASLYSNPSSTAFTGANNYFFNYFDTPTSTGSTTGTASTIAIAGAPANATTAYALNVIAGKTYLGGVLQIATGASNGFVLTSDASGNASWTAPSAVSTTFSDGTAGSPGITFTNQTTTGFFRPGSGQIGVTLAGTSYITFSTTANTFTNATTISAASNQLTFGTSTNAVTINGGTSAAARTYTIPDAGTTANFIMSTFGSAQTIAGGLTSSGTLTASNGFTLTTGALNLTSTSGAISLTGTTFSTNTAITISAASNQITLGTGVNAVTINGGTSTAARTYTIPDAGTTANFIMSTFGSAQTIAGGLTSSGTLTASNGFTLTTGALNLTSTSGAISLTGTTFSTNTAITISAASNQLTLGTGVNAVTINGGTSTAARTYTIPNAGTTASFVMTAGNQTLSGTITFSGTTAATSSTTGNIINSGGMGIARNLWLGSNFSNTMNGVNGSVFNIPALTFTDPSAAGTVATNNIFSIVQPTIASTNAVTTTRASTLYVGGAPIRGTNETFTNVYGVYLDNVATTSATVTEAATLLINNAPTVTSGTTHALKINAGRTYIGGALQIPTGATNGFVLTSDASGNATWAATSSSTFADGTAGAPGIAFTSESTTGFFRPGSGQIGVTLAGTSYVTFTSTSTTFSATTAATSSTTGNVINSGGTSIAKNLWLGSNFSNTMNGVNGAVFNIPALTFTDPSAAGTVTANNIFSIVQPTIASTNAITTTRASTLYVGGAPIKGTNETFTNVYGVYLDNVANTTATVTEAATLLINNAPTVTGTSYAVKVNAGKVYVGDTLQIPTGATDKYVLQSDATGNATWAPPFIPNYNATANGTISTNSTTLTNVTTLTLTPTIAGTYLFIATIAVRVSNANRTVTIAFAKNGTTIAATSRTINIATTNFDVPVTTFAYIACNGTDSVTLGWSVSANTVTANTLRSITATRVDV